jgi:hypothetical protein
VGWAKTLARYGELPPLPRLRFAGDYFDASSVGRAHRTGLEAAGQLLADLG